MTGTNHALTGALIAMTVKQPALAIPLAFASHFVVDMLPHYGLKPSLRVSKERQRTFRLIWHLDVMAIPIVLILLAVRFHDPWVVLGAIAAISPDFAWAYRYTIKEKMGKITPGPANTFNTFHAGIQRLEFVDGWIIELVWFLTFAVILVMI